MAETKVPWAAASNRLTARWCAASEGDFVLSGAGLWPLLAALAPAGAVFAQASKDFQMAYSTSSMLAAFACATLIGVVFGFLPARSAARLDPVQALAHE